MNDQNINGSIVTNIFAFLIGVILLQSFGTSWLNFESVPVFLAGLIGVATAMLLFAAQKIRKHSNNGRT